MKGAWRIVILVRRIDVAVAVSILLHLLLFALPTAQPKQAPRGPVQPPLQVVLAPPRAEVVPPPPVPEQARPLPIERPTVRPVPKPSSPRPTLPAPVPSPEPVPEPQAPAPPAPSAPPMDMLAMLDARRAARAAERARLGAGAPGGPPSEDAATRNLRTLTGGEGVGGVFEITQKNVRTGQYRFNGFRPDQRSQWRELIDVDAGPGGNIEVAMVRSMIELIRKHYSGDFKWDSHRLGRVVTLSARPEDQSGLEEFMLKEFFGNPRTPRG